jgi:hypothetical protein
MIKPSTGFETTAVMVVAMHLSSRGASHPSVATPDTMRLYEQIFHSPHLTQAWA